MTSLLSQEILQEEMMKRDSELFYQAQYRRAHSNVWQSVASKPLLSKDDASYYMFKELRDLSKGDSVRVVKFSQYLVDGELVVAAVVKSQEKK